MKETWGYIARFAHVARAVEVALAGNHSLRIIGHPDDTRLMSRWVNDELVVRYSSPCLCGNYKSAFKVCSCSIDAINEHLARRQGFEADMTLEAPADPNSDEILKDVLDGDRYESFEHVALRVKLARAVTCTSILKLEEGGKPLFKAAINQLHLTLADAEGVLKVAETIAKMEYALLTPPRGVVKPALIIKVHHLAEALQYRPKRG